MRYFMKQAEKTGRITWRCRVARVETAAAAEIKHNYDILSVAGRLIQLLELVKSSS